jgi:hypothetical protein
MTEHGNTPSEQKSTPTPSEWPPVTYLTMAYEPVNTRHAIISAIEQVYLGEKTIVLIHQDPAIRLSSSLINIVNVCATGAWPALWLAKLEAFVKVADPDSVAVWWDEDDMFDPFYTTHAVVPIRHYDAVGTWTDKTYYVKKGGIVPGTYPRSNGTLAVKVDALKAIVPEIRKMHPDGHRIKQGMTLTVDPTLVKLLGERYGDNMMDHIGLRYYFMRSGGNGGPRRAGKGVNVDE